VILSYRLSNPLQVNVRVIGGNGPYLDAYMFPKIPTTSTVYGKHRVGKGPCKQALITQRRKFKKGF
jgi:hypothetical protein